MIASIIILVLSACMFAYWFRYTCMLILQSVPQNEGEALLRKHGLTAIQRITELKDRPVPEIHALLDRDYRVLQRLATRYPAGAAAERRLLAIDYTLMKLWSRMVRPFSAVWAYQGVVEMSKVLGYFAAELRAAHPAR